MSVTLDIKDLARYPFTREARRYIEQENIDLDRMLHDPLYLDIMNYTYEKLLKVIKGGRHVITDSYMELMSFPLAIFVISVIGNDLFAQRFAVFEAKKAHFYLIREDLNKIVYIANSTFGWNINIEEVRTEKTVLLMAATPLPVYLKYASNISGTFWNLANQWVYNGYVYLTRKALARLIEEGVVEYILSRFKPVTGIDLGLFRERVLQLEELVKEKFKLEAEAYPISGVGDDAHPPCMRVILSELKAGKTLPHLARFSIVTYLRALGWDAESVIKLFSKLPDFNERITRYQVEHIFGLRGSGKIYSVPSCQTLKTGNLCYAGGNPICPYIKHPLQYVRKYLKRGKRAGGYKRKP